MATNIPELKAECVRRGVTLEELASRIGINNATLYRKNDWQKRVLKKRIASY